MSFIEGVGDEVTGFAVFLLILILAATVTYFLNGTPFSGNSNTSLSTESTASHSDAGRQHSQASNTENCSVNSSAEVLCNDVSPGTHVEHVQSSTDDVDSHVNNTNDDDQDQNSSEEINSSEDTSDANQSNLSSTVLNEECPQAEQRMFEESEVFRVRLKYLDDTERTVDTDPRVKIGDFKRNHFPEDISANKIVRLIFSGQLLQDNSTLQSYGVTNNCVIHVQILPAQTHQNISPVNQTTELDLSHLLWPLLSVILGICWILYFKYPDFFNVMSLGMLFIFTGSFVYFYSQVQQQ